MKISDIGEFGLIDAIKEMSGYSIENGIGDDCAIIDVANDKDIVVTTDTLVEDVHFFKNTDAYRLGRKSLAVSISDVAAMAALPKWAFLAISLRKDTDFEYIKLFMKGFYDIAGEFDILLLGGDTTKSSVLSITVTLIGESEKSSIIRRKGAQPGDDVYVTGKIGCSYAGFYAIKHNFDGFEALKEAHLNPNPRIKEALKIKPYATAMIDVSDGLLQDCLHICEQSGVAMDIDFDSIPFCDVDFVKKKEMIVSGEDYELVFCASSKYKDKIKRIGNITKIGSIKKGFGVNVLKNGRKIETDNLGFKHF